ncbi:MAG: hypothetical protein KJ799_17900 [Bacteroidetes bacterium]|nr:hypothetical protein [Bacteroidota bacterium]MBU2508573.1 hypothetical protein [Bacteroidota bacterium]
MVTNLLKKYPELLEIMHLNERDRKESLKRIFKRDIVENTDFIFRTKQIRPLKIDGKISMETLFDHLTTEEEEDGYKYKKRIFEKDRSMRIHWIKEHIDESVNDKIEVFSLIERDQKQRKDVTKTYLYNSKEKYVIVFEVQRSGLDYFLLSAYYLNRPGGEKGIKKKLKKKLNEVL